MRGSVRVASWVATVALTSVVTVVAYRSLESEGRPVSVVAEPQTYAVQLGEVSASQSFVAKVSWQESASLYGLRGGVITAAPEGPAIVANEGDTLFSVDMMPTYALQGQVPAFRGLAEGVVGPDVAQLRAFLGRQGYLSDPAGDRFTAQVRQAVTRWQRDTGTTSDGTVPLGTVLFIPALPATLRVGELIEPGRRLADGEAVLTVLATEPDVIIPLSGEQRSVVPIDAVVEVQGPGGVVWPGKVTEATEDEEGGLQLRLGAPSGGSICGGACPAPAEGAVDLAVTVFTVQPARGPVVPRSAIRTEADGSSFVRDASGRDHPVEVVAASGGTVVVRGVEEGTSIQLLVP